VKIFLWLVTIAFAIVCFGCWLIAHLVVWHLHDFRAGHPLPGFTRLILFPHGWLLFCPTPWTVAAAVLSFRREFSPAAAFIFAGTASIGMVVILFAVAIAAILAVIPLKI
jgi:hypothetical protein